MAVAPPADGIPPAAIPPAEPMTSTRTPHGLATRDCGHHPDIQIRTGLFLSALQDGVLKVLGALGGTTSLAVRNDTANLRHLTGAAARCAEAEGISSGELTLQRLLEWEVSMQAHTHSSEKISAILAEGSAAIALTCVSWSRTGGLRQLESS